MDYVFPFNNSIETGLRMLTLLTSGYPDRYELDQLLYLDYMVVHIGDIHSSQKSLHPGVPNRTGEILVRRKLIQDGLELFLVVG